MPLRTIMFFWYFLPVEKEWGGVRQGTCHKMSGILSLSLTPLPLFKFTVAQPMSDRDDPSPGAD